MSSAGDLINMPELTSKVVCSRTLGDSLMEEIVFEINVKAEYSFLKEEKREIEVKSVAEELCIWLSANRCGRRGHA